MCRPKFGQNDGFLQYLHLRCLLQLQLDWSVRSNTSRQTRTVSTEGYAALNKCHISYKGGSPKIRRTSDSALARVVNLEDET
ncbi:hypothetical protein R5R35_009109 [Gryllus longicercus]|uniref:Uncharacterized protein n=1 Tax=Gryllus longicercus TaxID=2509291 RepID=A0AAN9VSM8_9ORTH